jgi:hypothetical protein
MSFFNIFGKNKEKSPNQDSFDFDLMDKQNWIRGELEFSHQHEKLQMRANANEKVTLGMLLNRTFDVRKEEVSDMYVVSHYHEKTGTLIRDEDEIWDYDLCSPILWENEVGEMGFKFDENVVLVISYRRDGGHKKNDKDRSISRSSESIIVHLRASTGGDDTFFLCATICLPPFAYEKHKTAVTEYARLQGKVLSVTYAYDRTPPEQRLAEYTYLREDAIEKATNHKSNELTDLQHYLIQNIIPTIGKDFYWGKKVLKEQRFWDAIIYFENVYNALQEKWIEGTIADEEKSVFYESCFKLGFCFCELKLYEKALYYLDIVWPINNTEYKMEYINCLVNKKDFRGIFIVQGELDRIFKIKRTEWTDAIFYYYDYLRRRETYILIDMGKYDEAETVLKVMLTEEVSKDFALGELAYIQKLRKELIEKL